MARRDQPFGRQFFGYRRTAVDEHLIAVDRSIGELNQKIAELTEPDNDDLVLRATRRAVDDVLQRAHAEAERVRAEAEMAAAQLLADAYEIAAVRDKRRDVEPTSAGPAPVIDLRADEADPDPTPEFTESISQALGE